MILGVVPRILPLFTTAEDTSVLLELTSGLQLDIKQLVGKSKLLAAIFGGAEKATAELLSMLEKDVGSNMNIDQLTTWFEKMMDMIVDSFKPGGHCYRSVTEQLGSELAEDWEKVLSESLQQAHRNLKWALCVCLREVITIVMSQINPDFLSQEREKAVASLPRQQQKHPKIPLKLDEWLLHNLSIILTNELVQSREKLAPLALVK